MAFRDYTAELVGTIPHLPHPLARTYINRAYKNIRDMRLWSWLVGTADLQAPAIVTTGTVTVTLGSTTVTLDSDAAAALTGLQTANPPLASTSLGTGRQIRIGNTGSGGPLYFVTACSFAGPNTLTLDRAYGGASGSAQPYQVYKAYFSPPDTDFLRYFAITNMSGGYTIKGRRLYYKQERLNAIDPQRGGNGDAYIVSNFRPDANGRPIHEWYPHPTNARLYNCLYQKRGADLSDSVDLPATLPESCLMSLAMVHAASWAVANANTYPELSQTNWVLFAQDKRQSYKDELLMAIKQDDEIYPHTSFQQGSTFDFPLGGEFMQSHDVSSLIGGI